MTFTCYAIRMYAVLVAMTNEGWYWSVSFFSLLCYIDVNWDWRRCSVSFYYMLLRLFIACFILFGYKWKFSYYLISISRLIKLFSIHLARVFLPRSLSLNQILILLGELSIRSLMRPLLATMSHMPHFK